MSAREEAARWFTILHRGVMTLEERTAYEQWLAEAPHRRAMVEMQQVWDLCEPSRRAHVPAQPARRAMIACMCIVSLGIVALSYAHTSFWTSLDWVTR